MLPRSSVTLTGYYITDYHGDFLLDEYCTIVTDFNVCILTLAAAILQDPIEERAHHKHTATV